MAILLPARTGVELYERALADATIPYRHEGARDFFQRDEVRDLIAVLAAIERSHRPASAGRALRSSAFGMSDDDLVLHVATVGTLSTARPTPGPVGAMNAAVAELADLHRMRTGLSLVEVVRRVVERTRLVEFALTPATAP